MLVKMVKTGGMVSGMAYTSGGRFPDPKITAGMAPNSYTKSSPCPGSRKNWYMNTMAFTTTSATVTTGFIDVGLSSRSGIIRRDRTFVLQRGQFRGSTDLATKPRSFHDPAARHSESKFAARHLLARIPGSVAQGGTGGFAIKGVPLRGTLPGAHR